MSKAFSISPFGVSTVVFGATIIVCLALFRFGAHDNLHKQLSACMKLDVFWKLVRMLL